MQLAVWQMYHQSVGRSVQSSTFAAEVLLVTVDKAQGARAHQGHMRHHHRHQRHLESRGGVLGWAAVMVDGGSRIEPQ